MIEITVSRLCSALDTPSVDQAVLNHARDMAYALAKGGPLPDKRKIETADDRHFNLAVTAVTHLASIK